MTQSFEFDEALAAHQAWLERLDDYIRGSSTAEIDLDKACDFNGCGLGLWLNRERDQLAGLASFEELEKTHKLFHTVAGDVICLVQEQQVRMADMLLKGAFTELSADIVRLIQAIKAEYQGLKSGY